MRVLEPRRAAAEAVAARPERPATTILYDAPDARLIAFRIGPGQAVSPHRNDSTVILSVVHGSGVVSDGDGDRRVSAGDLVVYEPNEVHGMRAVEEELVLLATITPRPGQRQAPSRQEGAT